jgi:hypothetical protein
MLHQFRVPGSRIFFQPYPLDFSTPAPSNPPRSYCIFLHQVCQFSLQAGILCLPVLHFCFLLCKLLPQLRHHFLLLRVLRLPVLAKRFCGLSLVTVIFALGLGVVRVEVLLAELELEALYSFFEAGLLSWSFGANAVVFERCDSLEFIISDTCVKEWGDGVRCIDENVCLPQMMLVGAGLRLQGQFEILERVEILTT